MKHIFTLLISPLLFLVISIPVNAMDSMETNIPESEVKEKFKNYLRIYPLHGACATGDIPTLDKLVQEGADINEKDHEGNTPLHIAMLCEKLPAMHALLEYGAYVDAFNKRQQTPVDTAIHLFKAFAEKRNELAFSSSSNCSRKSQLALHKAARQGNVCRATELLERGYPITYRNYFKETALYDAIRGRSTAIIQLLLKHGTPVNCTNANNQTPLGFMGKYYPCATMARLLIAGGAPLDADTLNDIVVGCSSHERHAEVLDVLEHCFKKGFLLSHGEFEKVCINGLLTCRTDAIITLLLDNGIRNGYRPTVCLLNFAIKEGRSPEIFVRLAQPDTVNTINFSTGLTPFFKAMHDIKNAEVIDIMIRAGAEINGRHKNTEKTPLHYLLGSCRTSRSIAFLMLNSGADITARDNIGNTPLHSALMVVRVSEDDKKNCEELVLDILKTHTINREIKNICGQTLMDLAQDGYQKIVDYLLTVDDTVCSICTENNTDISTSCRHEFHYECLQKWLQTSPHKNCPQCRHPIRL